MSDNEKLIGHVTVRIPMYAVTEQESWELPQTYEYLRAGEAEIVEHDIQAEWYDDLHEDITRDGLDLKNHTPQELMETFNGEVVHAVNRLLPSPQWSDKFEVQDVVLDDEESRLILNSDTLDDAVSSFESDPGKEFTNGVWRTMYILKRTILVSNYARFDLLLECKHRGRIYRASVHQLTLPQTGTKIREFDRPEEVQLIQKEQKAS